MINTARLTKCLFSFEGTDPQFVGYFDPQNKYWNGWLNPYVTEEVHQKIVKSVLRGLTPDNFRQYDDALAYASMRPDEGGLYYWGGCFCWDLAEPSPASLLSDSYNAWLDSRGLPHLSMDEHDQTDMFESDLKTLTHFIFLYEALEQKS